MIPRLEIPVFTNLGFQEWDYFRWVDRLREIIPEGIHPAAGVALHHWLSDMSEAFSDYDMKRFGKIHHEVVAKVKQELQWMKEDGDEEAQALWEKFVLDVHALEQECMPSKR